MSNLGGSATFPLELGGDDSSVEKAYGFFRGALGEGGSAGDDSGIDGLRNASIALGLAAISAFDERAALQAFPHLAIDALPSFEQTLGIVPPADATEHGRREVVAQRWTEVRSSEIPTLVEMLQRIDPRFVVHDTVWSASTTVQTGRAFEAYTPAPGEDFALGTAGTRSFSEWPNYSDRDVTVALLDIGAGIAPGRSELAAIRAAQELLDDALPAWDLGYVITELGFVTNSSLTGYAGVSA